MIHSSTMNYRSAKTSFAVHDGMQKWLYRGSLQKCYSNYHTMALRCSPLHAPKRNVYRSYYQPSRHLVTTTSRLMQLSSIITTTTTTTTVHAVVTRPSLYGTGWISHYSTTTSSLKNSPFASRFAYYNGLTTLPRHHYVSTKTSSSSSSSSQQLDSIVLYEREDTFRRKRLALMNLWTTALTLVVLAYHILVTFPQYERFMARRRPAKRLDPRLAYLEEAEANDPFPYIPIDVRGAINMEPDSSFFKMLFVYMLLMLYATHIYARRLVSKIVLTRRRELLIWTHQWPSFRPNTEVPPFTYALGTVRFNTNGMDVKRILNKLQGNLHHHRGHVGIYEQTDDLAYPLLLNVRFEHEYKEPEILLHALVNPAILTSKNFRTTFQSQSPSSPTTKRRTA